MSDFMDERLQKGLAELDPPIVGKKVFPLLVLLVFWVSMLGGDWWLRMSWFGWHKRLLPVKSAAQPSRALDDGQLFTSNIVPARTGGDLSGFLPHGALRTAFEEKKPGGLITKDDRGYENREYGEGIDFEVVVTGDSYMAAGVPVTNTFASRLSELIDKPVLNRSRPGVGHIRPMRELVSEIESGAIKPKVIVWGFIEREIHAKSFINVLYRISSQRAGGPVKIMAGRWTELAPRQLAKSLPDTSIMGKFARDRWSWISYVLFDRLPPEIFIFDRSDAEPPRLGFKPAIEVKLVSPQERNIAYVVDQIAQLSRYLGAKGMLLLIVPIPDKESVYLDQVPSGFFPQGKGAYGNELPGMFRLLDEQHVAYVDLYSMFLVRRDELALYWRDDTHWNHAGIALAAELVANRLSTIHPSSGTQN